MRVLLVHQNFPGQYKHIAPALAAQRGTEVVALGMAADPGMPGVRYVRYGVERGSSPNIHRLASDFETKVIRGEAAARAARKLNDAGFRPDIVCAHPGWGETLFLKEIWPDTKVLTFFEFFYSSTGADVDFDPEFPLIGDDGRFGIRAKNAGLILSMLDSDWSVAPTAWQAAQAPALIRDRISVVHDGVDTDKVRPNPGARIKLGRENIALKPGDELVTFVNRDLEPYRGYHSFIRALPEILRRRPKARAVLVGGTGVSYGGKPADGRTYKDIYLEEVRDQLDLARVHFVGRVPYQTYLNLLQVSAAHVYLTYPFVLSWSMLESMAAGCVLIGSRTPPVEEVLRDGENGLLVDFFSPAEIAERVVGALADHKGHLHLRHAARRTVVENYDLKRVCLPQHLQLIRNVSAGALSPAQSVP